MKINKFIILSIVFIAIAACISFFDDFFRDYLDDSIVILIFYIFGIIGVILAIIALHYHKRESNKFSIYSVFSATLIAATVLFLIAMPPCQCGSRPRARDAVIKSDMYQLRSIAEDYYDNNDSYTGFEEDPIAIEIREDIIEMKGANLTISISPDGKQYCAEVLLNKKEWYCIDDTLIAKEYSDNPKCSSDYFSCEDETADWQTYRNEEYKYEIKYPTDWTNLEASPGGFNIKSSLVKGKTSDGINSRIFLREGAESNQEYIDNLINQNILPGYLEVSSKKEVSINGIKGYEIIWQIKDHETDQIMEGPINVFLETPPENKARFILVIFAGEVSQDNPNLRFFNKILSTFRFLD